MFHFCTISSRSHEYKVKVLADGLAELGFEFNLHVLWTNQIASTDIKAEIKNYQLSDLKADIALKIIKKYKEDQLRWSLKPVFLTHLTEIFDRVIYIDNDIFFYNDYRFLFDLLNDHNVLLTPHHYLDDPNKHQNWLEATHRVGLFNAGYVGANNQASMLLNWWAQCCLYRCEKNYWRGLYDDQKYLDQFPIKDERVKILTHKGCNVASWNTELCPRHESDGQVLIDGKFPIIFIHFNHYTLTQIPYNDQKLLPYFQDYIARIKSYQPDWEIPKAIKIQFLIDKVKLAIWKVLDSLKS